MQSRTGTVQQGSFRSIAVVVAIATAACGGLYDFGGGGGGQVDVSGTIQTVVVASATRDIVVFVYSDICETKNADPVLCADLLLPEDLPALTPSDYRSMRSTTVRAGSNGNFRVNNVNKGDLTVAFLQDSATNRDRTIDPEDITITRDGSGAIVPNANNAVAVLPDSSILQAPTGSRVNLDDVDIDFPAASADSTAVTTTSVTATTATSPASTTTVSTSTTSTL